MRLKLGDGKLLVGIDEIDAVMFDCRPVLCRWFGCADVHVAVDLHRIDRQNLGVLAALGKVHRDIALAAGRRSEDDNLERQPATTGIRILCVGSLSCSTKRPVRWCGAAFVICTVAYEPARMGAANGK